MKRHTPASDILDTLVWDGDRAALGATEFRLERGPPPPHPDPGSGCFRLYKTRGLLEQYAEFWRARPAFVAENVLEIGIWDGGSTALWNECFRPQRYVAVDYMPRGDSAYFRKYKRERSLENRVTTYWGIDQADRSALHGIVQDHFRDGLDLVIDDASHQYANTRASFETLFPAMRDRGWYIIEDWAWGHWSPKNAKDPQRVASAEADLCPSVYRNETRLSRLVFELVVLTARTWLARELVVRQGFVAVERSDVPLPSRREFRLDEFVDVEPVAAP